MSLFSRFRRGSAGKSSLVDEAVMVIDQHALPYRSPDWYGHANYHIRVFRPAGAPQPIVVMGDLSNNPIASVTNKCPEVMDIVANLVLGMPGLHPTQLEDHARWLTYYTADGGIGEQYTEVHSFEVVGAYSPPLVKLRYRTLWPGEANELVGASLRAWRRSDYTAKKLERRSVRVMRVHGSQ